MKVYFDTCCLMRPFDDQSYPRIRLETQAISDIMGYVESGQLLWVSGKAVFLEVSVCPSLDRRNIVLDLLRSVGIWQEYTSEIAKLLKRFVKHGLDEWDAHHLATAEIAGCSWFFTTDRQLVKRAEKIARLSVRIANPTDFIMEETT